MTASRKPPTQFAPAPTPSGQYQPGIDPLAVGCLRRLLIGAKRRFFLVSDLAALSCADHRGRRSVCPRPSPPPREPCPPEPQNQRRRQLKEGSRPMASRWGFASAMMARPCYRSASAVWPRQSSPTSRSSCWSYSTDPRRMGLAGPRSYRPGRPRLSRIGWRRRQRRLLTGPSARRRAVRQKALVVYGSSTIFGVLLPKLTSVTAR